MVTKDQSYGEKSMRNTKIYLFSTSKKLCVIIGYRSSKIFVLFSEVPVTLRIFINRILFYVFIKASTESLLANFCPYLLVSLLYAFLWFVCVLRVFGSID